MRKITDFIVDHCYVIFVVFLVLTGICGILATKVRINKDIYAYMPADSETSKGLSIMNNEFNYSDTSSYKMMLENVPADQKIKIKEYIESVEGVSSVDYDESEKYNHDEYTLYEINVDAPADSETAERVYNTIHDKYKKEYEIAESGQIHEFNGSVIQIHITVLAVGFAMVILVLMSKSWVEPFLFLFAILLAVVVNKGTNIIFPSVSHITDAIAAILQMALSMDYAIMLSTRYRQEKVKKDCPNNKTAMRRAMRYSFGAISSSSITTVVGLIVLIFMSFTIGRDMGLVLSKGVVLSLVSIFTSLPALLLIFDKAIEKTAKRTLNLKLTWLGECEYSFRLIALPVFLFIFIGSFFLKGNTIIDYTASQNNKIKDVFSEANQMALVYDKKMDEEVTDFCKEYDARKDTIRVLCYGNTINEQEKYNEIVPKMNEISEDEKVDTEDYLIKTLYYHYYRNVDAHQIELDDFVTFLQRDVFPNSNFKDEIDGDTVSKVNRLSNFTNQKKVNQLRTKKEIASILGVSESKLDDVFVLYFSEQDIKTKLTFYDFSEFVKNEVLTNKEYSSMVSNAQREDLAKLNTFSNSKITNSAKNSSELSNIFGIDKSTIEKILVYYNYTTTSTPTIFASVDELVEFALNNENVIEESGLSDEQISNIKAQVNTARAEIKNAKNSVDSNYEKIENALDKFAEEHEDKKTEVEELKLKLKNGISVAEAILNKKYSYSDVENIAGKINSALEDAKSKLNEISNSELLNNLDAGTKNEILNLIGNAEQIIDSAREKVSLDLLPKLKSIYKLYQAETTANSTKVTPKNLVDFLLSHANDDKMKDAMTSDVIARLKQAQFIMNNQSEKFTSNALASTLGIDNEKNKLVYALYEYRHVNNNPRISLKTLINFIEENVLPNEDYASRLSEDQQIQLKTIAKLMHAAENGVAYNYDSLYRVILPLSNNIDKNKIFLAYLYNGSLYDYDENWTLTIEQFVNFLNDKVLPDSRFKARINDETENKIKDGHQKISEAKELLVGPKHYRALIETALPVEGNETFDFIRGIKEKLGPKNKIDYFLVGDSAMAYEMSQSFSGEMDFITVLTMLAIFAVVVCTFKSIFVSMLLVLVIQCAVYIVMAYLSLTGSSIYFIALIIVQAILMGATIDYAILFTSYYIENRNYFKLSVRDAIKNTYQKSIIAILTSASILIIVTAVVGNFTSAIAGKICQSISLGTFCATTIILILLPALLATLDKFIIKKHD